LNAGDIHLDAAPKLARSSPTHQHPDRLRVLATTTRRRLRFGRADPRPWAESAMLNRQHGTCAICLRMVSETLCVDHRPKTASARHLVCDECVARHWSYQYDPDVARLLAANRARPRCADDG
jgi:hypothetical protein